MTETEKINKWTEKSLLANGYLPLSALEDIQITAWSSVKRILTSNGYIYLKQIPLLLSLEPVIAQILHNKLHANVPIVVDMNRDLNCFLMKDAGKPFYHFNESQLRLNLICEAINKYRYIQNESIPYINTFLDLGVPDWRLAQLPFLYKKLIIQEDLLINDGMSIDDIKKLSSLFFKCSTLCEQLGKFSIPETLDHCDLHGGNILIEEKTNAITIIDWGETVITHPYLSLTVFFRGLVQYYAFKENELWNCFENKNIAKQNDLEKIIFLTKN